SADLSIQIHPLNRHTWPSDLETVERTGLLGVFLGVIDGLCGLLLERNQVTPLFDLLVGEENCGRVGLK
ncbi:unnamed protein product, partial [Musa banksii]